MKLKTYVSNFNGVNSNKFLCNAFIFIIYVSNSNGVNSNFILIIFFTNRRIVSNSNGVNSNLIALPIYPYLHRFKLQRSKF